MVMRLMGTPSQAHSGREPQRTGTLSGSGSKRARGGNREKPDAWSVQKREIAVKEEDLVFFLDSNSSSSPAVYEE
jgi:hypothetical protein